MKRMLRGFLPLMLLVSTIAVLKADDDTNNNSNAYFSIRSQGINAARDLVGWQTEINRYDMDCFYAALAITGEYTRSFRPNQITQFLFGSDLQAVTTANGSDSDDSNNGLVISGSRSSDARGAKDWLGDYFGLPTNFKSNVSFRPRITNFVADFALYCGFDEWMSGLYFRMHVPVAHTRWDLNIEENIISAGTNAFAPGYMANAAVPFANLPTSWVAAMQRTAVLGDIQPLQYGKLNISSGNDNDDSGTRSRNKKTRVADVELALGWNFWQCEDYNFGINLRVIAPTGTRPHAEYLFEATVGNGHHWGLGGGLNASAVLWRGCDDDRYFAVYADANITHLFKTKQTRSFDFNNKPNSRYVLLEQFTSTVANGLGGGDPFVAATSQYAGKLVPAINVTTLETDVSIAVQGDFALKFSYVMGGFEFDLGYNLWGRSGEKFNPKEDKLGTNQYAIKGDAFVYGFRDNNGTAVALSATESGADIHGITKTNFGSGAATLALFNAGSVNPNIDNPQLAFADAGVNQLRTIDAVSGQINTSIQAKFLSAADLNTSKSPSALSNKVFAHLGYSWIDCEDWVPFIGIGGEGEFASRSDDTRGALSQWGVWVKGGLAFN